MHRVRRALYLLAASVIVVSIAAVVRTLTGWGSFSSFSAKSIGVCTAVAGVAGARDLKVDAVDGLAFLAARDGLYAFKTVTPEKGATRLAGAPPGFRPRALGLFRGGDGKLTLTAVGRMDRGAFVVRIFDVADAKGDVRLSERAEITGGLLSDPAYIAAASPDQFYLTNEHTSRTRLGRDLEDWLLLPRANVVYFDGNFFRKVAQNLSFARGIDISADGGSVYVASASGRAIVVFTRNPFNGALEEETTLPLPSGPDGLALDSQGHVWVAAHPKLIDLTARGSAPTQVFEITFAKGTPPAHAALIYSNAGGEISAASAVGSAGARFFIAARSGVLDCPTPRD